MLDVKHLIESLKDDEGLRLKPYRDINNILTIGYGRNLESVGISKKEAEILLFHDVERAILDAEKFKWYKRLSPARKYVVVQMIFNLGYYGFCTFVKLIRAIEEEDWVKASWEMRHSKWADQVKGRALTLANIMLEDRLTWSA